MIARSLFWYNYLNFQVAGLQIPVLTLSPPPKLDPPSFTFFFTSGSTFAHCLGAENETQRSTDDDTMAEGDGDDV